jgi:iron(III) transport system permease protein
MLTRAAFSQQSVCVLEAGRALGYSPWGCFWRLALPLARPAIAAGAALVAMETLNDFGTVDFFAIQTMTTGIYNTWLSMNNIGGAAQIAVVMLIFVITLVWIERRARRNQKYHHTTNRYRQLPGYKLKNGMAVLAFMACALPVGFGFLLPVGILIKLGIDNFALGLAAGYLRDAGHSLSLSASAAGITIILGGLMAYASRLQQRSGSYLTQRLVKIFSRVSSLGYALPGAVLAVGVMIPVIAFDSYLDELMMKFFGISTGLLISGSAAIVVIAYVIRFLAIGHGAGEAGLAKITGHMDDAARSLGEGTVGVMGRVHLPLIRSSLFAGGVLVFVDSMKELPATLLLRPFNYETLATIVYQYASDEMLDVAALGALTIVLVGIGPVIMLAKAVGAGRPGQK